MKLFILSVCIVGILSMLFTLFHSNPSNTLKISLIDSITLEFNDTLHSNKKYCIVRKKNHINHIIDLQDDSNKRYIYLTFDDGPDAGTPIIANILRQENVAGTFFIIGWHVITKGKKMRNYFKDSLLSNPFFLCSNHSFTHAYFNHYPKFYKDVEGGVEDFVRNQDTCKFTNKIVRGPGSNVWWASNFKKKERKYHNREIMMDSLIKLGYVVVGWDLEWDFTKKQTLRQSAQEMVHYVNKFFKDSTLATPNHLVLLMHDRTVANQRDADSLQTFIKALKKHKNYEFRYLSEYPMVRKAMKLSAVKD